MNYPMRKLPSNTLINNAVSASFSGKTSVSYLNTYSLLSQRSRVQSATWGYPLVASAHNLISNQHPRFFGTGKTYINKQPVFNSAESLQTIASHLTNTAKPFENVMVVAVQHILGTTVDMFKQLHQLGLEHVIIGGKSYSTHDACIKDLKELGYTFIDAPDQLGYGRFDGSMQETTANIWRAALEQMQNSYSEGKKIELLIVLDDGGDLILSTPGKLFNGIAYKPNRVIGIEQTRGGSNHRCFKGTPYPVISVAGSYVKTAIEYPWVAELIAEKVTEKIQPKVDSWSNKPIIGVVGNGAMGQAIAKRFSEQGYHVLTHDKVNRTQQKGITWYNELPSLISNADIIIGCTGTDITAEPHNLEAILNSVKNKYFVSTSSKDIEFNTLLTLIQEQKKQLEQTPKALDDILYKNPNNPANAEIEIARGGFPINFDNKLHCVPPEKIWPTRAALMSACLMAVNAYKSGLIKSPDILQLSTDIQLLILKEYQQINADDPRLLSIMSLTEDAIKRCISENSEGIELPEEMNSSTPNYARPECV